MEEKSNIVQNYIALLSCEQRTAIVESHVRNVIKRKVRECKEHGEDETLKRVAYQLHKTLGAKEALIFADWCQTHGIEVRANKCTHFTKCDTIEEITEMAKAIRDRPY